MGRIIVPDDCLDYPCTREILDRAGGAAVEVLTPDGMRAFSGQRPAVMEPAAGKKTLVLDRNRGRFLKSCPGTREYLCCGYQVLNIGQNCPMDCTYCILQAYLNQPWLSFFVNIDDLFAELAAALDHGRRFWRIGTGEFTDSLALDRLTGLSRYLVAFFSRRDRAILELKTKTAAIGNLAGLDHGGRVVVSWSLNTPSMVATEERHTASLTERLAAAARCASWGYRLAFHFDPLVLHPGWRDGYAETVSRLFAGVPAESIAWISLGALRFLPELRGIAEERFPQSSFFAEEFITGLDGKCRYFRPRRVELYGHLYSLLRERAAPRTCIYLCMESPEIWREVFGFEPAGRGGLPAMLDRSVLQENLKDRKKSAKRNG